MRKGIKVEVNTQPRTTISNAFNITLSPAAKSPKYGHKPLLCWNWPAGYVDEQYKGETGQRAGTSLAKLSSKNTGAHTARRTSSRRDWNSQRLGLSATAHEQTCRRSHRRWWPLTALPEEQKAPLGLSKDRLRESGRCVSLVRSVDITKKRTRQGNCSQRGKH
jgi:hypothetical protein